MFIASQPQLIRPHEIARLVTAIPSTDADGLLTNRVVGTISVNDINPFLRFDELRYTTNRPITTDFSAQPKRGFESLTYMLAGQLRYRDTAGNSGTIAAGGARWTTAGSGIRHAETPTPVEGELQGFHIWLNLPACEKMQSPRHVDIAREDIPGLIYPKSRSEVRVVAGRYHGLMGPIAPPTTQPMILDVRLTPEAEITLPVPESHVGFVYVYEGAMAVEQTLINRGQAGILDDGNVLTLVAGALPCRAMVLTARMLHEPIARHGPFVMNTHEEIKQAFTDHQQNLF